MIASKEASKTAVWNPDRASGHDSAFSPRKNRGTGIVKGLSMFFLAISPFIAYVALLPKPAAVVSVPKEAKSKVEISPAPSTPPSPFAALTVPDSQSSPEPGQGDSAPSPKIRSTLPPPAPSLAASPAAEVPPVAIETPAPPETPAPDLAPGPPSCFPLTCPDFMSSQNSTPEKPAATHRAPQASQSSPATDNTTP